MLLNCYSNNKLYCICYKRGVFIQMLVLNPVLAQVMENLESLEIKEFNFPGLESHGPEFNNTVKPVLSGHPLLSGQ